MLFENKYDRHRRHLEENQISQLNSMHAQLDVQREGVQLNKEQLEQAERQHEQLMAAQREQADQARRAQWAAWIQTEDGKRYLAWQNTAIKWRKMMKKALGTWNDAWIEEFDAAGGPAAKQARSTNQWIGSPVFKTAAIWLSVLAALTLLKGLIFEFGVLSTIIFVGSIIGGGWCGWKHFTDWAPRNDATRKKVTEELNRVLGHDVFATYPAWPDLFLSQYEIEASVESLRTFIDNAPDTFPRTFPAIPAYSFTTVDSNWPASVRTTHDELRDALS